MNKNTYSLKKKEYNLSGELVSLIENPQDYPLAVNYIREEDFERAFREFKSFNINQPTCGGCFNLGLISLALKDYVKATGFFEETLSYKTHNNSKFICFYLQSIFLLSLWYFNKRDFTSLDDILKKGHKLNISRWNTSKEIYSLYMVVKSILYLLQGFLYIKTDKSPEAISYFKNSLKYNNCPLPFYYLAMAEGMAGNFSKSFHYINKALSPWPENEYLKNTKKLISLYKTPGVADKNPFLSLQEKDLSPVILRNLSWIVIKSNNPSLALNYLNKGIASYENSLSLLLYKGLCLEKLNDYEGALMSYQKALELGNMGFDGNMLLAMAFYKYGHYEKAKELFKIFFKENNNSPYAMAYLSAIEFGEGHYPEASAYLENLMKVNNNIHISIYLMESYYRSGELQKALELCSRLLIKDYDNIYRSGLTYFKSLIYIRRKEIEPAIRELNDSLRFDKNNPEALSYKGFLLAMKSGKSRIAKNWQVKKHLPLFREALYFDSDCSVAYLHLALVYHILEDNAGKDWALGNLFRLEIEERHIKLFKIFYPEFLWEFEKKLKIKKRIINFQPVLSLYSHYEDKFSPFSIFSISKEEELFIFEEIYRMLLFSGNTELLRRFMLEIEWNDLTPYHISIYENLLRHEPENHSLIRLLNDYYVRLKYNTSEALNNYLLMFSFNPGNMLNTSFLAKILREKGEYGIDGLSVYEKYYELNPYDKDNMVAFVNALMFNNKEYEGKEDLYLHAYFHGKDFPERKKLIVKLCNRFILEGNKSNLARNIYREFLKEVSQSNFVKDFLANIYIKERKLDEEALELYMDKLERTPGDKELIRICGNALFLHGRTDGVASEIYGKVLYFFPSDRANLLIWVYSLPEEKREIPYLEEAFKIISHDVMRYKNRLWYDITSSIIKSLSGNYSVKNRKDMFALKLYKLAMDFYPSHEDLKYSFLISALENDFYDISLIDIYKDFYKKTEDNNLKEKILIALKSISILYNYIDEDIYGIYRWVFENTNREPLDIEFVNLWNYLATTGKMGEYFHNSWNMSFDDNAIPSHRDLPFIRGLIYLYMGSNEKALFYMEKACKEDRFHNLYNISCYIFSRMRLERGKKDELLNLSEMLINNKSYGELIETLEKEMEKGCEDPIFYYYLARAYFEFIPHEKEYMEKSLYYASMASKGEFPVSELLIQIYLKTGNFPSATGEIEKLSDERGRYYYKGLLLFHEGKYKDAMEYFETVFEIEPHYGETPYYLSSSYSEMKSYNPSHIEFTETFVMENKNISPEKIVKLLEYLHEYYRAHCKWDKELSFLGVLLNNENFKNSKILLSWFALALINLGEIEKVFPILNNLADMDMELCRINRIFAGKLLSLGRYDDAKAVYEKIYKARPEFENTGFMLEMLGKERVGRFSLISSIGSGANAEVWKVFDLISMRYVSLKILHPENRKNKLILDEISREYNLLMELNFPGIVNVIPESFGEYYFAMELLDNSLSHIIYNKKVLSLREIMEISLQITEILGQLHKNNIIYQDLSPDNIMFSGNMVKICDFGGVKKIDPLTGKTFFGAPVAHLSYASPEQCASISGMDVKVDYRTDIYSLGVLIYQMATGELPFNLPDPQLISAHQYSNPVPPIVKKKDMPGQLNDLILKCLEKNPSARFQNMKEIWLILQQIPQL